MFGQTVFFIAISFFSVFGIDSTEYQPYKEGLYGYSCSEEWYIFKFYAEVIKDHWSIEHSDSHSKFVLVRGLDEQEFYEGFFVIPLVSQRSNEDVMITDEQGEVLSYTYFDEGDIILITFKGDIMESDPALIPNPISIKLINQSDSTGYKPDVTN